MSGTETRQATKTKRLPFHEAVVVAIEKASSHFALHALGDLIMATKIPMGHDEILKAWRKRWSRYGGTVRAEKEKVVTENLLVQKAEVEQEEAEKRKHAADFVLG